MRGKRVRTPSRAEELARASRLWHMGSDLSRARGPPLLAAPLAPPPMAAARARAAAALKVTTAAPVTALVTLALALALAIMAPNTVLF
jgi:hypothetical protein